MSDELGVEKLLRDLFGERVRKDESLARYTSFHVGGPADWLVRVERIEELVAGATLARQVALPLTILGGGSNILVSDRGIRGLVLLNKSREYTLTADDAGFTLVAESGVSLPLLAGQLARAGAAGFEWAIGVPGTIGGAVVQNAGAWGSETRDRLLWVEWLTPAGAQVTVAPAALDLRYRHSAVKALPFQQRPVVLRAAFRLDQGDPATLQAQVATYTAQRTASQPRAASGGSTFANPPGDYAGRLIEAAGLKGRRVGGAEISPQHANFIVTGPGATASNIRALIEIAQREVAQQFGIQLTPEIELLGEWG